MKNKEINPRYLLNREKFNKYLQLSKSNPSVMLKAGLDYLASTTNGELDFVDASNPAMLALELSAQLAANNFNYFSSADKKHYPIMATTMDDLYHHMSDELYSGRFASPSTGKFTFRFLLSEIIRHAVPVPGTDIRKIILPRGGRVQVDGIEYTFLSAIEIRVSSYDSIQVMYHHDYIDAYEKITSNILEYYFNTGVDGKEYLSIEIPLLQVSLTRTVSEITHIGNVYNSIFEFPNKFIKARIYLEDENGTVNEINTTHSDVVYDPNHVTARLTVLEGGLLKVDIPLIYYSLKLASNMNVIAEIYTTRGKSTIPLKQLTEDPNNVSISFEREYGLKVSDTTFTAPIQLLSYGAYCETDSSGGNDGLTFDKIKKWVIEGGADKHQPITEANLKMTGDIMGYSVITALDNITGRKFKAMRELDAGIKTDFTRGASCTIESVPINPKALKGHPDVSFNETRFTLLPSALYRSSNGIVTLLNRNEVPVLEMANVDNYINQINRLEYVYTPFYYCVELDRDNYRVRPFHMDRPRYISHSYADSNDTVQINVSADMVTVERDEKGYRVRVVTRSGDTYKNLPHDICWAQLSFKPHLQREWAYVNGEFAGTQDGNRVFEFHIETSFDFSSSDKLIVENFKILTKEDRKLECELDPEMMVIFGVYDVDAEEQDMLPITKRAGLHLLDYSRPKVVLTDNRIQLILGHSLKDLWTNIRPIDSGKIYKRYEEDVPLVYTETVYELDDEGMIIYEENEDGQFEFSVEHRIGEVVLDEKGDPLYKHRAGDVMLDEFNNAIVEGNEGINQIIDIMFVDGIYRFSTNKTDIEYMNSIPDTIVEWIENDISRLKRNMLEQTTLALSPKRTMGYVTIVADDGIKKTIFNRLPFEIKFYLTDRAYRNYEIRDSIVKATSDVLNEALKARTVSKDSIEHALKVAAGDENIHGIEVIDMGIGKGINTFTLVNEEDQCTVRRKIVLQSDGSLKVKEDIDLKLINHEELLRKELQ